MKSVRNLFRVNKKKEGMKDPLIKSVRNIFKTEKNMINIFLDSEENYQKPKKIGNILSNDYTEY